MTSPVKIWRNQKKIASLANKKGKIISWTFVRVPPAGFESQAPYPVALIRFDDDTKILAQMVDYNEKSLKIGQKVITVIRRTMQADAMDIISYGIKVKPI